MNRIAFFDRWAPNYDSLLPSVFYQAVHVRLLEFVQLPTDANVLEIGCGTGKLLNRLAQRWPDLMGVGADLSEGMIEQAHKKTPYGDRLQFIRANVTDLPLPSETYDGIFCTISFLHYPNPVPALTEIARVLKPNGQFYLADFVPPRWLGEDTLHLGTPAAGVHLYSAAARKHLAEQTKQLRCDRHAYLLGPVMMTQFSRSA